MKKIERFIRLLRNFFNLLIIKIFIHKKIEKKKYYSSICGIFKNEGKYIKEWIDYHIVTGVEHFYLYNNFSSDNFESIIKPYIEKKLVTLINWPHEGGQMSAYNDCIQRYSEESNWIGFIDLDEYVCPIKHENINDWLKNYEWLPCAYAFWRMFSSAGHLKEERSKTLIEQFNVCAKINSNSKFFLNTAWTKNVKRFSIPHNCRIKFFNLVIQENANLYFKLTEEKETADVQINHYYSKSFEYYVQNKINRGSAQHFEKDIKFKSFIDNENICAYSNYNIYKYLIKLKTFNLDRYCEQIDTK